MADLRPKTASAGRLLVESALRPLFYALASPYRLFLPLALKQARREATTRADGPILEATARSAGAPTCVRIPAELELDFLTHRSPAYFAPMSWGIARQLASKIAGTNAARQQSPKELAESLLRQAIAHRIERNATDDGWILNLDRMQQHHFFRGFEAQVVRFEFSIEHDRYAIHDAQKRVHRPADPTWQSAFHHLIACISVHVPAGAHSWVHFYLPDVAAAAVHEHLPRDTNLYRLLAPHVRFTARINNQALWIQRSTDNLPDGSKHAPWLAMPLTKDDFRGAVLSDVIEHYEAGDHFALPQPWDRRIPYFDFLAAYHQAIATFVDAAWPHLEADAYTQWAKHVEQWIPGFSKVKPTTALAVLIWQVGVLHYVDHKTYYSWAVEHGFSDMSQHIEPGAFPVASADNRYRFLNFLDVFVRFWPATTGLDQRLVATENYDFAPGTPLRAEADELGRTLRAVDADLRARGSQLVRADEIIRSVCF